jgi:hypothetical protein
MWTHVDVAMLLEAAQTANLLIQGTLSEPRPGIEAMLGRWDEVVPRLHR